MTPFDEALLRMRESFARQAKDRALRLERALIEGDRSALVDVAHKIAGIAGMVGFPDLGERAAQVEDLADRQVSSADLAAEGRRLAKELFELGSIHQPEGKDD
ncbi:Hpt domain-containing protein [Alteraurantiacibacter buctensis]|uniref:HPt domain-containing protein n=1 Tax=Alteraurantiacibacter buctensis TaxID=1503981 RepID=A0A844YWB2_9SPHN|nr:Hpt domain-containing protein [Alteraurantiacibacter buctensis]MXO70043.1 hypothetical protein [Alteraurantiacibacter buctensis]